MVALVTQRLERRDLQFPPRQQDLHRVGHADAAQQEAEKAGALEHQSEQVHDASAILRHAFVRRHLPTLGAESLDLGRGRPPEHQRRALDVLASGEAAGRRQAVEHRVPLAIGCQLGDPGHPQASGRACRTAAHRVVRGDDDGDPELAAQRFEQFEHLRPGGAVEVAGRFVGDQESRPRDQRAGDGDALLLAARELVRPVSEAVRSGERDPLPGIDIEGNAPEDGDQLPAEREGARQIESLDRGPAGRVHCQISLRVESLVSTTHPGGGYYQRPGDSRLRQAKPDRIMRPGSSRKATFREKQSYPSAISE